MRRKVTFPSAIGHSRQMRSKSPSRSPRQSSQPSRGNNRRRAGAAARYIALIGLAIVIAGAGRYTIKAQPPAGRAEQTPFGAAAPPAEQTPFGAPSPPAGARPAQQDESDPFSPPGQTGKLYEQEPFEELRFTTGEVAKIVPLKPGQIPENVRRTTLITVQLLGDEQEYTVEWGKIERHVTFPELILEKAEQLVTAETYDQAYDYYQYLLKAYPRLDGLEASIQRWLFLEAATWHRRGNPAQVLAILSELYNRNPKYPNLDAGMAAATDRLMTAEVEQDNYAAARKLLANLQACYPQHETAATWQQRLIDQASEKLAASRKQLADGRTHEARELALQAVTIWPLDDAVSFLNEAQRKSPRVVVGVTQPATSFDPAALDNWAARRSGMLLDRPLLTYLGPGARGGRYHSPLGTREKLGLGRQIRFRLSPDLRYSNGEPGPTGYDLCRRLVALADPYSPEYQADWAALFESCQVENIYTVTIALRQPHVHPDGLFQLILPADDPAATLGAYAIHAQDQHEIRYRATGALTAGGSQPAEIIERYITDGRAAARALRNGQIAALDRVNPWDVPGLKRTYHLNVAAYSVPTVHVLVPNIERPLLRQRTFRRALLLAIHREAILEQLLDDAVIDGCQVLSGPLPAGIDGEDPIGYAYDRTIEPRSYAPRLALTLTGLSLTRENVRLKQRGEPLLESLPPLVIAHPATDPARVACRAIAKRLELLKFHVTLRELPPGETRPNDDDYDLLYAEWTITEPITDLRALFGHGGLVAHNNPYLEPALLELDRSQNWKQARERLHHVHRLLHEDVTVLPLWQIVEHFAWHRDLQGLAEHPATLYQQVERWQSPPAILSTEVVAQP